MIPAQIVIRETVQADLQVIAGIHRAAFGHDLEAELTAALLSDPTARPLLSLIALCEGKAMGHALFTRCAVEGAAGQVQASLLAPLAVLPEAQRQGVGRALIVRGLETLRSRGCELVFVLGHKDYYQRYGFRPDAARLGFATPYPIAREYADYWMVRALTEDIPAATKGRVVCADTLARQELWSE